jgi:hypothetical protein
VSAFVVTGWQRPFFARAFFQELVKEPALFFEATQLLRKALNFPFEIAQTFPGQVIGLAEALSLET